MTRDAAKRQGLRARSKELLNLSGSANAPTAPKYYDMVELVVVTISIDFEKSIFWLIHWKTDISKISKILHISKICASIILSLYKKLSGHSYRSRFLLAIRRRLIPNSWQRTNSSQLKIRQNFYYRLFTVNKKVLDNWLRTKSFGAFAINYPRLHCQHSIYTVNIHNIF